MSSFLTGANQFHVRQEEASQMAKRKRGGEFEIAPAGELQQKYGLYAENRPRVRIDPAKVPAQLRRLIPLAERWAIGCDITRRDYFDKQPEADVRELARVVAPYQRAINRWLDSIPGSVGRWPRAAVHFQNLLKAWCEAACEFPGEA